jgi:hypothetical protein
MKDDLCRRYDAILRDVDPHLEMVIRPSDTARADRAVTHWIIYRSGSFHPPITTLEALLSETRGPGPWIRHALGAMQWWIKVAMARTWQSFTPSEVQRQNLLPS